MNPQNYTINIRPGWGISPVVKVSQGDVGRPLAFTIMDGQDAITLSSTATVTITGTKPSGLGFTQDCTLSGNTASIDTVATMTQEAGSVPAELIVTDGSTVIGTANFVMHVEPAAHPEGTTDGDAETARDLMTRAQAAVEQAEAEADRAEEAAESASQTGISTAGATAGQVPTANGAGGWSWQDQQGGGGGTSDDIENKSTVSGATVTGALNSLSDQLANLEGGAPTAVSTVAQMVDTTKIYLYTGSETGYTAGHWYYYSGGAWTDGGVYGAVSSNVFSDYAKETLITILRSAMYTSDQSGNINKLEDALARQVLSIGATIDLGGNTIYTDDELDTLRQYLTVTATYDDMTTSPVTGYALSGTLVAGTSTITITYQGNSTTVSIPVSQAVVRYAVTYNLTGVTSSNTDTTIAEGNTYTTTLTAETAGYKPSNVIITMGGTNITSTAYDSSTRTITISNVQGDIVISASEEEIEIEYGQVHNVTSEFQLNCGQTSANVYKVSVDVLIEQQTFQNNVILFSQIPKWLGFTPSKAWKWNNDDVVADKTLDEMLGIRTTVTFEPNTGSKLVSIGYATGTFSCSMTLYGLKCYDSNNNLIADLVPTSVAGTWKDKVRNTTYTATRFNNITIVEV